MDCSWTGWHAGLVPAVRTECAIHDDPVPTWLADQFSGHSGRARYLGLMLVAAVPVVGRIVINPSLLSSTLVVAGVAVAILAGLAVWGRVKGSWLRRQRAKDFSG